MIKLDDNEPDNGSEKNENVNEYPNTCVPTYESWIKVGEIAKSVDDGRD